MPLDHALPPPRLPLRATPAEIARHFPAAFGVRVDADDLPPTERPGLAGARLPDPAEARLLDRVLQCVPPLLADAAARILIVDSGAPGRFGSYRAGIVRIYTPALRLTLPDPECARRFSYFTTTVVHELGHAAYAERLTSDQQAAVAELYLAHLIASGRSTEVESTESGAEHYFAGLLLATVLRVDAYPLRMGEARERLQALGLRLP